MMPKPVLGGIVVISFGMVTSVGLSSLQFVNLSSGRNLCIIGLSLLLGLMIPSYLEKRKGVIDTGIKHLIRNVKYLIHNYVTLNLNISRTVYTRIETLL